MENKSKLKSLKKKILSNNVFVYFLVLILLAIFVLINTAIHVSNIKDIDITENKIYTLSDASKDAIKNIDTQINIVTYGFDERSNFISFVKQYVETNPEHITYEILTEESNPKKVKSYDLSYGYLRVILETADGKYKSIDPKVDFTTYDYVSRTTLDTTEQTLTNAILNVNDKSVKNAYFLTGHGEYNEDISASARAILVQDGFNVENLNLSLTNKTFSENDALIILSPKSDLTADEYTKLEGYVNSGINIFYTQDYLVSELPYFDKFLDLFGVKIVNGYVIENDSNYTLSNSTMAFMPILDSENKITKDIYTDSYMLLMEAAKLDYISDSEAYIKGLTKKTLMKTTKNAIFTSDLTTVEDAQKNSELGEFELASIITKKMNIMDTNSKESKLIVNTTGYFVSDYLLSQDNQITISSIGGNLDYFANCISTLCDKTNFLTVRKDVAASNYTPTQKQAFTVFLIVFLFPIVIIVVGIVISKLRKRRK